MLWTLARRVNRGSPGVGNDYGPVGGTALTGDVLFDLGQWA